MNNQCIGCGYCCVSATCVAGVEKFGVSKPCKGLKWDDENKRHYCILCIGENQSSFFYRKHLHIGEGCCSNLNSWRREPLQDRTKTILSSGNLLESPINEVMQHFLVALGQQFISSDSIALAMSTFYANLLKAGYDVETTRIYCNWTAKYIAQSKSSFMEGFMG